MRIGQLNGTDLPHGPASATNLGSQPPQSHLLDPWSQPP